MEKKLKEFLKKHKACKHDGFDFAKDLTLEQFLSTCHRGDWILWLFVRMNPNSLRELTLAKGHCANTVRELMKDERNTKAVDVAIAFGEEKATREELDAAAAAVVVAAGGAYAVVAAGAASAYTVDTAYTAAVYPADYAAAAAADTAYTAAVYPADTAVAYTDTAYTAAVYTAAYAAVAAYAAAKKQNQKQTADICRKYLPLEIWDQNLI